MHKFQLTDILIKISQRDKLVFLSFCGFAIIYAMRVNLSVAIVGMVLPTDHPPNDPKHEITGDSCPVPDVPKITKDQEDASQSSSIKFKWDEATQGEILGSFFYGYTLTNLFGGRLAEKIGGRRVFGLGVVLTALLTLISPFAAYHSKGSFVIVRILEGMTEGVTFPSMNVLMSKWIPPFERARAMTRILGGSLFGTVWTLAISGWLCESQWGWPSVFYSIGCMGLVWGYFWFKYIYESPDQDPNISASERSIIIQSLGDVRKDKNLIVPWGAILTSPPFLAVIFGHVCANWGFYNLLTELPTYLTNIQHFDIKNNGLVSALPYLIMWIFSLLYSTWADKILNNEKVTLRQIRGFSTAVALFGPMILLLFVTRVGCEAKLAVGVLCLAIGMGGACYSGFLCAFQELAPNYSGTLTGLSNTMATIPGFIAPKVTGIIINNNQTLSNWNTVFQLSSFIYFSGCVVYLMFYSVDVQSWNYSHGKNKDDKPTYTSIGDIS